MNEKRVLRRLAAGDSEALAAVIETYSAYVCAIIKNIIQPPRQPEDVEEVAADVFMQLWRGAGSIEEGGLKPWLAAVARNRAKDKLRALHLAVPLEEDFLTLTVDGPEERVLSLELAELTREAVEALPEPECSIFQRYYYLYQKIEDIAEALNLNPATVRTKLRRGRERLRVYLGERGYRSEADCV